MIDIVNLRRFWELRAKVFNAIQAAVNQDVCCKNCEGTFEWTAQYPDYFEDTEASAVPNYYILRLYCYILGPHRHYEWSGTTPDECLDKAEKEISDWL